jgi:TrmH family RNA methyltransferase
MLRIVLVEPREAGNVGAAARVMKNFGFEELWIVGEHPVLQPLSSWWASGADDVVQQARFTPDLGAALADAHVTVATSSLRGRTAEAQLTPFEVASVHASLRSDQTVALVFGRENSGLTQREVALCQRTAVIPTNPAFPTMNLAQAVGAFCFVASSMVPAPVERELAPGELIERLHQRAQALLLEVGFLHDSGERIYDDLRAIAGRADLDAREAKILLGVIRQIKWKIEKEKAGGRGQN